LTNHLWHPTPSAILQRTAQVPFLYDSQLTRGRGVDRPWRRPKVPPVTLTASTAGFAPRCASDFVLVEENRHYSFGKSSLR